MCSSLTLTRSSSLSRSSPRPGDLQQVRAVRARHQRRQVAPVHQDHILTVCARHPRHQARHREGSHGKYHSEGRSPLSSFLGSGKAKGYHDLEGS